MEDYRPEPRYEDLLGRRGRRRTTRRVSAALVAFAVVVAGAWVLARSFVPARRPVWPAGTPTCLRSPNPCPPSLKPRILNPGEHLAWKLDPPPSDARASISPAQAEDVTWNWMSTSTWAPGARQRAILAWQPYPSAPVPLIGSPPSVTPSYYAPAAPRLVWFVRVTGLCRLSFPSLRRPLTSATCDQTATTVIDAHTGELLQAGG